jgi:hypothetical protein
MRARWIVAAAVLTLFMLGCGEDENTAKPQPEVLSFDTLLTNLEYPTGLWPKGDKVYFTETNGRNTGYGGKIALSVYTVSTKATETLVNNPVNSDAVVVASDNYIYLTSYGSSIPGESGRVSYVHPSTHVETPLVTLEIASLDMHIDANDNITIIGSSDQPAAKSLYRLPVGNYTSPVVLKQGLGRTRSVSVLGNDVYYADLGGINKIVGMSGSIETFATRAAQSMSFSSKYLFYVDYSAGTAGRINLATKDDSELLSGLHEPTAVRWDSQTQKLYILEGGTNAAQYKDGTLRVISGIR